VANWRVEPDLTVLDLLQDRSGGEGLGDAADAVPHIGSDGAAGADIGNAGGAAPHMVAVAHLGDHSRHPFVMDFVHGGLQLRGIEWVLPDIEASVFCNCHPAFLQSAGPIPDARAAGIVCRCCVPCRQPMHTAFYGLE
jgi:hypothetical protein